MRKPYYGMEYGKTIRILTLIAIFNFILGYDTPIATLTGVAILLLITYLYLSSKYGRKFLIEDIKKMLNFKGFNRILEVETGYGFIAIELAKNLEKGEVVGVDSTIGRVRIAEMNAKLEKQEEKIKFLKMNPEELKFKEEEFDIVIVNLITSRIPKEKRKRIILEMYRVAKRGGRIIIADTSVEKYLEVLKEKNAENILEIPLSLKTKICFYGRPKAVIVEKR
ncbi:MAG TPA: class I SAM-dependent methyltransferase [Candidatus Bathyarchaeota archaeon]|nr:class I SAM-dependent methyltransferase [Candidatus Bathyarchaeota archaeon]